MATPTSDFVMHGAREAMASGMAHIEEQVSAMEQAAIENPAMAFDLAKTLIESTCRTILTERGIEFAPSDNLPQLFRTATMSLPFLPPAASGKAEARQSLAQTLNGLNTALQGVCELRNACGFASHGTDSPPPALESVQALLAAQASDAIVGFLHRVHRQERATLPKARFEYGHNPEFNQYVDDSNDPMRIFDLEYAASEVLFRVDEQAYRDLLANYTTDETPAEPGDDEQVAP